VQCAAYSIQIRSAVVALRKSQVADLWADDSPIQVVFGLQLIVDVSKKLRPKLIKLPHRVFPKNTDVCMIVQDNCSPTLLSNLKSRLGKVITMRKLRKNYKDFESKRNLCGRFDLFVYDRRISAVAFTDFLGKAFLSKKKNPIAIAAREVPQILREIDNVKSSALYFKNGGASTSIKVGLLDLTDDEIVENTLALLKAMYKIFDPSIVQSISLKTPDSVSLPIYNSLAEPPAKRIKLQVRPPASSIPIEAETEEFAKKLDGNKKTNFFL